MSLETILRGEIFVGESAFDVFVCPFEFANWRKIDRKDTPIPVEHRREIGIEIMDLSRSHRDTEMDEIFGPLGGGHCISSKRRTVEVPSTGETEGQPIGWTRLVARKGVKLQRGIPATYRLCAFAEITGFTAEDAKEESHTKWKFEIFHLRLIPVIHSNDVKAV